MFVRIVRYDSPAKTHESLYQCDCFFMHEQEEPHMRVLKFDQCGRKGTAHIDVDTRVSLVFIMNDSGKTIDRRMWASHDEILAYFKESATQ